MFKCISKLQAIPDFFKERSSAALGKPCLRETRSGANRSLWLWHEVCSIVFRIVV